MVGLDNRDQLAKRNLAQRLILKNKNITPSFFKLLYYVMANNVPTVNQSEKNWRLTT